MCASSGTDGAQFESEQQLENCAGRGEKNIAGGLVGFCTDGGEGGARGRDRQEVVFFVEGAIWRFSLFDGRV